MQQAIAGVAPEELGETTIAIVRPSMAAGSPARMLGQLYAIRTGIGPVVTVGHLLALVLIPVSLLLFFWNVMPYVGRRYRLTNRRVIIECALPVRHQRSVGLDEFDTIDIVALPGQEWYFAGEMIFRKGTLESFRLSGVPRPEAFRHTCLKAQRAHTSVSQIRQQQLATA